MASNWGIKISVDGGEVSTAADKDLVYSTKYNGMKILKHNTHATADAMAHGVAGYIPMFLNFTKSGAEYRLDTQTFSGTGTYATTDNIVFGNTDNYYFIFVDKGD